MTDTEPTGEPVEGEHVTLDAWPIALANAGRARALGRTAVQAFPAAALIGFAVYLLRLKGVDLNPLADETEMPGEQVAGLVALVTYAVAHWMNRPVA